MEVKTKLELLRKLMKENNIDAYYIDDSDKHGSEYVNEYYKERSYISSFCGSNGILLVLENKAYLWTDGRYFLQAEKDLKNTSIELMKMATPGYPSFLEFIKDNLNGKTIGLNGETVSYSLVEEIKKTTNVVSNLDLVDKIWEDRGNLITKEIWSLEIDLVGEYSKDKIDRVRKEIKKNNATSLVVSSIDDNAWLFNLRGNDIAITPAFLSFSYVTLNEVYLFVNDGVLKEDSKKALDEANVKVLSYNSFLNFLNNIKNEIIMVNDKNTNYAFINAIKNNNKLIYKDSPIQLFKAIKNSTEIKNNIDVHKVDGLAVFRFMKYVKEHYQKETLNEYELTVVLENYRKMDKRFYEVSFESIIGSGANGAIVHYEPTKEINSDVVNNTFLLVDSGGQYMGGTTDITRTYLLGNATKEMKDCYTLVLKSHIDVAMTKFLKGTTGVNIDMIARRPFWQNHLDYKHGTGHGIGYMLNVHEGPNSIRYQNKANAQEFLPGMITSNEPGIYLENKFGVRIESEILVVEDYKDDLNEFFKFDTITYAPIDVEPINKDLLSAEEINWLNEYHKNVYETLSKICDKSELEYLKEVTKEI